MVGGHGGLASSRLHFLVLSYHRDLPRRSRVLPLSNQLQRRLDDMQHAGGCRSRASLWHQVRPDAGRLPGLIVLHHGFSISLLSRLSSDWKATMPGLVWGLFRAHRADHPKVDGTSGAGDIRIRFLRRPLLRRGNSLYRLRRPSNAWGNLLPRRLALIPFQSSHVGPYRRDCLSFCRRGEYQTQPRLLATRSVHRPLVDFTAKGSAVFAFFCGFRYVLDPWQHETGWPLLHIEHAQCPSLFLVGWAPRLPLLLLRDSRAFYCCVDLGYQSAKRCIESRNFHLLFHFAIHWNVFLGRHRNSHQRLLQ